MESMSIIMKYAEQLFLMCKCTFDASSYLFFCFDCNKNANHCIIHALRVKKTLSKECFMCRSLPLVLEPHKNHYLPINCFVLDVW